MIKLSLYFKDKLLKVYQPKESPIKIGRDPGCDIAIENLALSPLHAMIEIAGDKVTLVDKSEPQSDTHFGLQVNNRKVTTHILADKDLIQLGKYALRYTHDPDQSGTDALPHTTATQATTSDIATAASTMAETAEIVPPPPKPKLTRQGWLQFMNGAKLGRTIKLDTAMIKLGKSGKTAAMISVRENKYYVSHLEGEPRTRVNGQDIPDSRQCLNDGDNLQIGETKMLFFLQ